MKICPEMVGKRVRRSTWRKEPDQGCLWWVRVEWVKDRCAGGTGSDGNGYCVEGDYDNWEILPDVKKPSQAVAEKMAGKFYVSNASRSLRFITEYANDRIDAILAYLDEVQANGGKL